MEENRHQPSDEETLRRAADNIDILNDPQAVAEAGERVIARRREPRNAPFSIVMLTVVILLGAIGSVSYYFMEYWGARTEYNIARDDCRALEEDLR